MYYFVSAKDHQHKVKLSGHHCPNV